jgi:hypothetical protein
VLKKCLNRFADGGADGRADLGDDLAPGCLRSEDQPGYGDRN